MRCPHCNETLRFILCPECQGEIPEKSAYCCWCGKPVEVRVEMDEGETNFSERILCSDGNCIGIINGNGICNVCGKPYTGGPL